MTYDHLKFMFKQLTKRRKTASAQLCRLYKPNMVNAPEWLNLAIFWGRWEDLICQKCSLFAIFSKAFLQKMLPVVILWVSAVLSTSRPAVLLNFTMFSAISSKIQNFQETFWIFLNSHCHLHITCWCKWSKNPRWQQGLNCFSILM